ncbi:universal stress protein [Pseudonocardia sp. N23]|uniref:universal stress protein n=1 Tax=Pseudonocardia sp. N23 TaxID=1987376 RepID=UPI000BFCAB90|nr:universal stress protein [Pseudonocardia sp. N23]GAY07337.1 universal stress protein family [Pseudonocardia sp. N23]
MSIEWHRPVVAGVDGSYAALAAVERAAVEAAAHATGLRLVAAVEWATYRAIGLPALGEDHLRDVLLEQARGHLSAAQARVAVLQPQLEVSCEVIGGAAAAALERESAGAALLVVGGRGTGGFGEMLLGSVALALAAHSYCPVMVVRDVTASADGPVVVGVDDSRGREEVLRLAFTEAAAQGCELVVVHAWSAAKLDPLALPLLDWSLIESQSDDMVAGWTAPWEKEYPEVALRRVFVRDGAAGALTTLSESARTVVVGNGGRGAVRDFLLGSVSRALVHHAHCSVLVVPAAAPHEHP